MLRTNLELVEQIRRPPRFSSIREGPQGDGRFRLALASRFHAVRQMIRDLVVKAIEASEIAADVDVDRVAMLFMA